MLAILLATYGAVFLAEIVGDKLLYTTGVLATRFRPGPIMAGMAVAFMAKMAVAVAVGDAIAHLPKLLVAGITTASFCGVAYAVWRKPVEPASERPRERRSSGEAAAVSFATIFFSEWGDVGQVTAATMAARYPVPLVVWVGAVTAMVTKGILAASIGAGLRGWIQRHIPPRWIRVGGVALLLVLGLLTVLEVLLERPA